MRRTRLAVAAATLLAVAVAVGVIGAMTPSPREGDAVATVDGVPITRAQFDAYEAVLSADGVRAVEPWLVIQSLINQRLALEEAKVRGYSVTEAEIDSAVSGIAGDGVSIDMVGGSSGEAAFRERLRVRTLFERVKAAVTASVVVTDLDIREYLDRYAPLYQGIAWSDAKMEVEPAVWQIVVDKVWSDWLTARRSCADITILMPSVALPTSSPEPACA